MQLKTCLPANQERLANGKLATVQFHPSAQVVMTAGHDRSVSLFQVSKLGLCCASAWGGFLCSPPVTLLTGTVVLGVKGSLLEDASVCGSLPAPCRVQANSAVLEGFGEGF